MSDEFKTARDWVETNLDICSIEGTISIQETVNIFVGSLLFAFTLTKDKMFLEKAQNTANCLLPAFKTTTGKVLNK